jgi:hypothetical protein
MAGGMINFVRIIETRPADVTIRKWRGIRHEVMRVMGMHWHQNFLPLHFEPNAGNVYHMQRRTAKYLEAKQKAAQRGFLGRKHVDSKAATDALTLSGTLRANVTQVATIRTFENRFKLIMPGTSYTPDRPRNPRMPPIAKEVTTLLEREKTVLSGLGRESAIRQLNSLRNPSTTTIT